MLPHFSVAVDGSSLDETKAGKAEAEAKVINELRASRKMLKDKLSELKHVSGRAWGDVSSTASWREHSSLANRQRIELVGIAAHCFAFPSSAPSG